MEKEWTGMTEGVALNGMDVEVLMERLVGNVEGST